MGVEVVRQRGGQQDDPARQNHAGGRRDEQDQAPLTTKRGVIEYRSAGPARRRRLVEFGQQPGQRAPLGRAHPSQLGLVYHGLIVPRKLEASWHRHERKLEKVSELVYLDFGVVPVGYLKGWELQRRVHARRVADDVPDSCLLLEHEPDVHGGQADGGLRPAVRRSGRAGHRRGPRRKDTWHGPGQLTGYPIIKLREPLDVVAYVRALERHDQDLRGVRRQHGASAGRSGAWVPGDDRGPDRKVGAIGARVARGVTMHGFALNADCDLSWYEPHRSRAASATPGDTLSAEAGRPVTVAR